MWKLAKLKKFFRKSTSLFLILHLSFFQLFSLAIPQLVRAQAQQPALSIDYDAAAHNLNLSFPQNSDSEYRIYYQAEQLEAITGNFSAVESVFLGTCSSDGDCINHTVDRLVVKVNINDEVLVRRLELSNNVLNVVDDYKSISLELDDDEQSWLENEIVQGWQENEAGSYTIDKVELDRVYAAPQSDQVTVTFTQLPADSGNLTIKEIILSDEQVEELSALSNVAYDITSDMEDGSFKYDLTLPNPDPEKEVSVKYSEDGISFEDVEGEVREDDVIKIAGLNHFTVFVVTDNSANYVGSWTTYSGGYNGSTFHYPTSIAAGNTATWNLNSQPVGNYVVFVSWSTHTNRSTNVDYTLNYNGSSVSFTSLNQELLNDQLTTGSDNQWSGWYKLGKYPLDSSSNLVLTTNDNSGGTEYVIADEVLLVSTDEIWVDDDWSLYSIGDEITVDKIYGANAFSTIQDGIDQVAINGVIHVMSGSYDENLVVDKVLNLRGLNADINPNTQARASEALINGQGGTAVSIQANNVTINGFSIKNSTGTQLIYSHSDTTTVINNILSNLGSLDDTTNNQAVNFHEGSTNGLISQNKIFNLRSGNKSVKAIYLGDSSGIGNISNITIANNYISDVESKLRGGYGILVNHSNNGQGQTTGLNISNNNISYISGGWAHAIGLEGDTPNATLKNNFISEIYDGNIPSNAVGIMIEDNTSASSVSINNNTFTSSVPVAIRNVVDGTTVNAHNNDWSVVTFQDIEDRVRHDCEQWKVDSGLGGLVCDVTADGSSNGVVDYSNPVGSTKSINFTNSNGELYGGSNLVDHLQVEAVYLPYQVDRVRFRYAPPGETCKQQYTSPYFNDLGDGVKNGDKFSVDLDVTGLSSGTYLACALMHRNTGAGSEGYKNINHAEIEVIVDNTPPDSPLFWVEEDAAGVKINWKSIADAVSYNIYEDGSLLNNTVSVVTEYVTANIGTHTYEVRAVDAAGNESASQTPKKSQTLDIVIDDDAMEGDWQGSGTVAQAGFTKYSVNQGGYAGGVLQNYVGGDSYSTDNPATGQVLSWTTASQLHGFYNVYVQYGCDSSRGIAEYDLYSDADKLNTTPVEIEQSVLDGTVGGAKCGSQTTASSAGANWVSLGQYEFNGAAKVELTAQAGEVYIVADSVGFEYVKPSAPVNEGWNLASQSTNPNDTPLNLECSSTDSIYISENSVAQNWSEILGNNIKYRREVTFPDNHIGYYYAGSNNYTPFSSFGGVLGIEGKWGSRVQAFNDLNSNGVIDAGEPESDWSNLCEIVHDHTDPGLSGSPVPTPTSPTNQTTQAWSWGAASDVVSGVKGYFWQVLDSGSNLIDNGWEATTSVTTSLVEGIYNFFVKAEDNASNVGGEVMSASYEVDTTPPQPPTWAKESILTRLGDVSSAKNTNLQFIESASEDVVSYQYQFRSTTLDNSVTYQGLLTDITSYSPIQNCTIGDANVGETCDWYAQMQDGRRWIFRMRAVDAASNKSAWSNFKNLSESGFSSVSPSDFMYEDYVNGTGIFTIPNGYNPANGGYAIREQVAPVTSIVSPTGSVVDDSATQTMTYSYADADTEVKQVELWYNYNGGADTLLATQTILTDSFTDVVLPDGDGEYCFYTIGEDIVDNLTLDAATGNREVKTSCELELLLDTADPTSIITTPTNDGDNSVVYENSWSGVIAGTASDDSGLVAKVWLSIQRDNGTGDYWNGTAWQTAEVTFETTYDGNTNSDYDWTYDFKTALGGGDIPENSYLVTSHAEDNAGNLENTSELTIIVDRTIPYIDLTVNPTYPDGQNSWYITRPEVTLTVTDDNYDSMQYKWDDGAWETETNDTKTLPIPSEGIHVLYYRAFDLAGNEAPSDTGIRTLRWDETSLSEGPQNVSVSPNPTSGTTATVSWDAASDSITIDKYEVIWQLDGTSTQHSKTVNSTTFETEIDQLTEGKWNIKVKAFDGVGNSKEGGTTLIVDRTAPSAPTLTLDNTGVGTTSLSWNAVDGAEEYLIFYGTTSGDYIYGANVGNVTSYTVQGLGTGNYYFIVRAKDAADNQSSNSNEVNTGTITGAPGTVPGGPAEGFIPAGEVQGATTNETDDADVKGEVMGTSESVSWMMSNLFWILLVLQAALILLADNLMRRKRGLVKHLIALLITALSIVIFNWSAGSLGSMVNWFMLTSVALMVLLKAFAYAFIEDVTNQ